jgi:hypothetical protein
VVRKPVVPEDPGVEFSARRRSEAAVETDELVRQVEWFHAHFDPWGRVPQAPFFAEDARRLLSSANRLRSAIKAGANRSELSYALGAVAADWGRLQGRVEEVAGPGRTGPNIRLVAQMGQHIENLRRLLGRP